MTRTRKLLLTALLAILLVAMGIVVYWRSVATDTNVVKIGVVLELTGASSVHGQDALESIRMALEKVNAAGGIDGKKVELVVEDNASKPAKTVDAVTKLITVDDVTVIIGPITTAGTLAGAEIADRHKVVLFSPTAASSEVHGRSPYCFRIGLLTTTQGERMAAYCFSERGIANVGQLVMNDETGVAYANDFRKKFEKLGGAITLRIEYQKTDTEFRAQLTKLKEAGISNLYVSAVPRTMGFICRQARELNYRPQLFANAGVEGEDLLIIGGDAAEGLVFTGLAPTDEFSGEFERRTSRQPSIGAPQAYDTFNIVIAAIRANGASAEAVRAYLHEMPPFTGVGGRIQFDATGEVVREAHLKTVRQGRFVRLQEVPTHVTK